RHAIDQVRHDLKLQTDYAAYQILQQTTSLKFLSPEQREKVKQASKDSGIFPGKYQGAETIHRYEFIQDVINKTILKLPDPAWKKSSYRLDSILTHRVWGYTIFFAVLFLIFQSIFAWAQIPMDYIDKGFADLSTYLTRTFPEGPLFEMIAKGI